MCSGVGATLHLLKKASVSVSTTSREVSSPPDLMAATTSECCFPSTVIPFTWRDRGSDREGEGGRKRGAEGREGARDRERESEGGERQRESVRNFKTHRHKSHVCTNQLMKH